MTSIDRPTRLSPGDLLPTDAPGPEDEVHISEQSISSFEFSAMFLDQVQCFLGAPGTDSFRPL